MPYSGIIVFILIVTTCFVSYKGLRSNSFFDKYEFEVDKILVDKDYKRLTDPAYY